MALTNVAVKNAKAGGGALDSFGTAEYTPGRPRELGVSLKYFF